MTNLNREAIRAACEAATPGPWLSEWTAVRGPKGGDLFTAPTTYGTNEDADFIALARTALPETLAALDAAEARVKEAEGLLRVMFQPDSPVQVAFAGNPITCEALENACRKFLNTTGGTDDRRSY